MGRNNPSSKCSQNSQVNSQGGKKQVENLHSIAKKEFAEFKRETKITGGGWPPKSPSIASKEILEVLEDTPAFSCLIGFETGFLNNLFCF